MEEEFLLSYYSWAQLLLALLSFFVTAPLRNMSGTGRFAQPRDAIGWADVKRSSGWWIIVLSTQKWGVMENQAAVILCTQWGETSKRVIYNASKRHREHSFENTPWPVTLKHLTLYNLSDLSFSNHICTAMGSRSLVYTGLASHIQFKFAQLKCCKAWLFPAMFERVVGMTSECLYVVGGSDRKHQWFSYIKHRCIMWCRMTDTQQAMLQR